MGVIRGSAISMQNACLHPAKVKHDASGPKILCWIAHISRPSSIDSEEFRKLLARSNSSNSRVSYSDHLRFGL